MEAQALDIVFVCRDNDGLYLFILKVCQLPYVFSVFLNCNIGTTQSLEISDLSGMLIRFISSCDDFTRMGWPTSEQVQLLGASMLGITKMTLSDLSGRTKNQPTF